MTTNQVIAAAIVLLGFAATIVGLVFAAQGVVEDLLGIWQRRCERREPVHCRQGQPEFFRPRYARSRSRDRAR